MKRDIRVLIIDTCGWITTIGIVIFFFTLWLYSYNNIQEPLKESWSIAFNSLSALATIGAAIVAATLFNDWKEQEDYKQKHECITKVIVNAESLINILNNMNLPLARYAGKITKIEDFFEFLTETYSKKNNETFNLLNNINHLSDIRNKGFSSETLFINFSIVDEKLKIKFEEILLKINSLQPNSSELLELKQAVEDMKEHLNTSVIRTLRNGLRKF